MPNALTARSSTTVTLTTTTLVSRCGADINVCPGRACLESLTLRADGAQTLERSYLLRINGTVVERPQHMLMRVAIGIHKQVCQYTVIGRPLMLHMPYRTLSKYAECVGGFW